MSSLLSACRRADSRSALLRAFALFAGQGGAPLATSAQASKMPDTPIVMSEMDCPDDQTMAHVSGNIAASAED